MAAKIDIVGQKFNRLVVLEDSKQRSASGSIKWKCQCDCGNITYATSTELRNGHKKSCGCLQKEKIIEIGHNNRKDLTGKRFGNLTVVEYSHSQILDSKSSIVFWKCKCDCGQELIVRSQSLITGNTRSCGCIKSFGEQKIAKILRNANINFIKEKIFDDFKSYRYDFYVDDYYVIEECYHRVSRGLCKLLLHENRLVTDGKGEVWEANFSLSLFYIFLRCFNQVNI